MKTGVNSVFGVATRWRRLLPVRPERATTGSNWLPSRK